MKKSLFAIIVLLVFGLLSCEKNHSPQITDMSFTPDTGTGNTVFTITAQAKDEDEDQLSYLWTAAKGEFVDGSTSAQVKWRAPILLSSEDVYITLQVSDSTTSVSDSIKIMVNKTDSIMLDERDGNTYKYKNIGTQTWMAKNLAYLPSVSGKDEGSDVDPHYYVYGYDGTSVASAKATDNYKTYGVLYNWTAATSDDNVNGKDICPAGWHLPTDAEWKTLEAYLGMDASELDNSGWRDSGIVGTKLKSISGWREDGMPGDNSSGFNGLPGGQRYADDPIGKFLYIVENGYFWTASSNGAGRNWNRYLNYFGQGVLRHDYDNGAGYSVRCIKD